MKIPSLALLASVILASAAAGTAAADSMTLSVTPEPVAKPDEGDHVQRVGRRRRVRGGDSQWPRACRAPRTPPPTSGKRSRLHISWTMHCRGRPDRA
jgi:hypothetical protein